MTIHEEALRWVGDYKKAESKLVDIIQTIDRQKSFREKGYTSCFDYCTKFLKLSESAAYDFIQVARKAMHVPALKSAIEQNQITISKARRIVPVLTQENANTWINLAQELPKEKLEKKIAKTKPELAVQERAKYITAERLKLELGVSEKFMKLLKRAQDIKSQRTKTAANFECVLEDALTEYISKHDPLERAKRADLKSAKLGPGRVPSREIPFNRTALGASIKHQINSRDQGQCTYIDSRGHRCSSTRWLQIHHKIPISHGGQNQLENLATLCWSHHQIQHN